MSQPAQPLAVFLNARRASRARGRFQARSWWILPASFVGVWIWVVIFKLIGVL
ncbi:hypothetical protein JYP51_09595 [Ponticoccus gilvus]|nr:hypothetical protein [Enemella evansiae]